MADENNIMFQLSSHQKLDRDKGVEQLRQLLTVDAREWLPKMEPMILDALKTESSSWETRHGCLLAAQLLAEASSALFDAEAIKLVPKMLEDGEVRVRQSAGQLIGLLCRYKGLAVFEQLRSAILTGIAANLQRDVEPSDPQIVDKLSKEHGPLAASVFHDTAGWKTLETYMNALKCAAEGCGERFHPYVDEALLTLLFETLHHTNRFVRETGFQVLAAVISCFQNSNQDANLLLPVAKKLALGLSDNWSQVRMAASVATRQFFLLPAAFDAPLLNLLIPPMCLNRYYVAEGVRVYSQETWLAVTKEQGVHMVESHMASVVSLYVEQSKADNHAVREAACACIAELASKVSRDVLGPYLPPLLSTLLVCFKDDCWPVRDAACLACGKFVLCFPAECESKHEEILLLCSVNLEDNIPSIRQGAATSIGQLVEAYGDKVSGSVFTLIETRLPRVRDQPSEEDASFLKLDSVPPPFGVVKKIHDNDFSLHSDQQMYSCGSLAPKMKAGGGGSEELNGGGHLFRRPTQPWETSEGCVHLLVELAELKTYNDRVVALLPVLAETTRYKQYVHHHAFFETVLKLLPGLAESLGKSAFKKQFEPFIDAVFYSLSSNSPLLQAAASDCVVKLTKLMGKMIIRGRIEQHNPSYLHHFDRLMH